MTDSFPVPDNDTERLEQLRKLEVLDSQSDPVFDALTATAATVCGAPIALFSLVDEERQWFKANIGLTDITETPRDQSICTYTIMDDDVLVVEDTNLDARFADYPIVTGDLAIRFYGGAPVVLSNGMRMGALCVLDRAPRTLTDFQRNVLAHLAKVAAAALEMRAYGLSTLDDALLAQERVTRLYNATPGMLHSVGPDGCFISVSDAWLENMGYERHEVIGRSATEFMTPESARFAIDTAWPEFFVTGRATDVEYQYCRRDGSVIDILLSSILERDDDGAPLRSLTFLRDITAQKIAERELRQSRDRLENILEGTNAGTWEWNVQTGEVRFNERWAEIVGYTLKELEPITIETWGRLTHPDDLAESNAMIEAHFAGEWDYYDCQARMRHKAGHWVWVHDRGRIAEYDADGKPLWMMGTHTDITAMKEAENELLASTRSLERTGQIANVGGWSLDLETNQVTWSDQTFRIHDLEPSGAVSVDQGLSFYPQASRDAIAEALREAIEDGKPWDLEVDLVTARKREIAVHVSGEIEHEGGKPVRVVGAIQDITRQREAEIALEENRELLQVTLESIGDAVITTNLDGTVRWLNPTAERMTGWTNDDAQGVAIEEVFLIVNDETRQPAENPIRRCLAEGRPFGLAEHTILISRAGIEYGIQDSAAPIRDRDGQAHGAVLAFHDVSEQRRLSKEMTYRATHDTLTGLTNRAEFEHRLQRVITNVEEQESTNALMYIDLDQFKIVNDSAGHSVGDQLLRQISGILRDCVRRRDTLARLGGDEFGVILEHCTVEQAGRVAQDICNAMDDFRFVHDQKPYRVGTSIGLVPIVPGATAAHVMQAADTACYAAKEAGRNRVHVWQEKDQAIRERQGEMLWASRIEQALDENRFALYGQRIDCVNASEDGVHFEVLLRLREDDGALIPPGAFLPAAERYHLASRVDRWVVQNVFARLSAMADHLDGVAMVSVNVSGQSIGDQAFHRFVTDQIANASFDVGKLCFEITETAVITHIGDAMRFVAEMRERGIRVALDDFGAGASSFGYLKSLPVTALKIDGQFIRELTTDPLDVAAVRCFCEVAGVVGIETVAEFVENEQTLDALREIGVDFAQGYLIHKPEPIEALLH